MKRQTINKHNQILGQWGEICAADYLARHGFIIAARNVRTPEGEIDLIAQKDELLVFVEVKTRAHNLGGYPEEAITEEKLEHMSNSAEWYLLEHPENEENWRIDVISVTGKLNSKNPQIEWFEDEG
jgi:putative endonuclease